MHNFQAIGIVAVILMFIWMNNYRGGFAWRDDPSIEFNIHPILMTFGLIFLYGNGKISSKATQIFNY